MGLIKIEKSLDPNESNELKAVADWSLVKKGIAERALEKLLPSPKDIVGVLR
jgi:hypothetical protein